MKDLTEQFAAIEADGEKGSNKVIGGSDFPMMNNLILKKILISVKKTELVIMEVYNQARGIEAKEVRVKNSKDDESPDSAENNRKILIKRGELKKIQADCDEAGKKLDEMTTGDSFDPKAVKSLKAKINGPHGYAKKINKLTKEINEMSGIPEDSETY